MDFIFSKEAGTNTPRENHFILITFRDFSKIPEKHWMFVSFGSIVKYRKEIVFGEQREEFRENEMQRDRSTKFWKT